MIRNLTLKVAICCTNTRSYCIVSNCKRNSAIRAFPFPFYCYKEYSKLPPLSFPITERTSPLALRSATFLFQRRFPLHHKTVNARPEEEFPWSRIRRDVIPFFAISVWRTTTVYRWPTPEASDIHSQLRGTLATFARPTLVRMKSTLDTSDEFIRVLADSLSRLLFSLRLASPLNPPPPYWLSLRSSIPVTRRIDLSVGILFSYQHRFLFVRLSRKMVRPCRYLLRVHRICTASWANAGCNRDAILGNLRGAKSIYLFIAGSYFKNIKTSF